MEQSFFAKLKRVKLGDILSVLLLIIAIPFAVALKRKRKDIWLLCDTRYEAGDNAFFLFEYIRRKHPECDVVFALDKKSRDFNKVEKLGPVIKYGSLKHWIYYLAADKNVSSQKMGKPNAAICYVLEVYGIIKNKRAFLQHGIITADLTFLHYQHTKMSLFVTSTEDEYEFVNRVYEYPENVIVKLGLCRFDKLHEFEVKPKQLLIMPTWRMYIRNNIKGEQNIKEQFCKTDYYKFWNGLLNDDRFEEFITENNIEVKFFPHREMMDFLNYFTFNRNKIKLVSTKKADIQTLLKESAFLVTDYSSVSMDFAYMKKPLAYYQFDDEKFRSEHHPKGDFSFEEDGFGPVCIAKEQIVDAIVESYNGEAFVNSDKYLSRHGDYFDLYDANNCERNYEAIKNMTYAVK